MILKFLILCVVATSCLSLNKTIDDLEEYGIVFKTQSITFPVVNKTCVGYGRFLNENLTDFGDFGVTNLLTTVQREVLNQYFIVLELDQNNTITIDDKEWVFKFYIQPGNIFFC